MKLNQLIGALILLVFSLWLLNWVLHPKPLDSVALPPYGLGQAFAEATAKAANDQGQVVLICLPTDSVQFRAQLEGFQKTLSRHKGIKLASIKNLGPKEVGTGSIPFKRFAELVQEQTQADVIVSFEPASSFSDELIKQLPQPCPKLVVMGLNAQQVRLGMNSGVVKAAIIPRQNSSLPSDDIKTARQWFDYYYELVEK